MAGLALCIASLFEDFTGKQACKLHESGADHSWKRTGPHCFQQLKMHLFIS